MAFLANILPLFFYISIFLSHTHTQSLSLSLSLSVCVCVCALVCGSVECTSTAYLELLVCYLFGRRGGGKRRIKNELAIDIFYICTSFFSFFFLTLGLYINLVTV